MEIEAPVWLDKSHPNFKRWQKARSLATARGEFVYSLVSQKIACKNLSVLDIGSGEGGTALTFSKWNRVASIDISGERLKSQRNKSNNFFLANADALYLPFKKGSFDLIILQDVIEHIENPKQLITEAERVLKPDGRIYLSTPNKRSIINFISDPHWGLPIVSILDRKNIKRFFLRFFRKNDLPRSDIAQLLNLNDILILFKNFQAELFTNFTVEELLNKNKGIIWSAFHLGIADLIEASHLRKTILKISNNRFGIINKYFTPGFYFLFSKKTSSQ